MKKSILVLGFVLTTTIAFTQWEWQYPVPQGNALNDIFYINQNTGWAVGDAGTIIRSEDGGLSYEVINYPTSHNLWAVEFFDLFTGFAVGDSGMLLKTSNGGNTWDFQDMGLTRNLTDICLLLPEKIWITGDKGTILYSDDNGTSWQSQFSDTSIVLNSVCFIDDSHGWVAGTTTTYESVLLHTIDGGVSWTQLFSDSTSYRWRVTFFDSLNGYGYYPGLVSKTSDGGKSWYGVLGPGYASYNIDAMFTDPDHGWVTRSDMYGDGNILYTYDGGETWNPGNIRGDFSSVFFIDTISGWAAGCNGSLARTADGGQNWTTICVGTGSSLNDVFFTDSINGWAVGGGHPTLTQVNSMLLHTDDGGSTWIEHDAPHAILRSIFFINTLEGWITGRGTWYDPNIISHTSNGGISWEIQYDNWDTACLKDIYFTDSQHGWAVGERDNYVNPPGPPILLYTESGGEIWEDQSYLTDKSLSAVYFTDQDNGWMAGNEIILHTTDGGQNWEEQVIEDYTLRDIYFIDNEHGWAVGDSVTNSYDPGIVMRTSDGGGSWEVTSFDQWSRLNKVFFADSLLGWIVGRYDNNYGILLHTNDGGITWKQQFINTHNYLNGIFFTNQDKGWVVGSNCAILHTNNGSMLDVEEKSPIFQVSSINVKSYPNPFSGATTIVYTIDEPCMVTVRIFNTFGQKVDEPVNEFQIRGDQKVIWNAERMFTGMYYYSITAGNSAGCGKLVVIK